MARFTFNARASATIPGKRTRLFFCEFFALSVACIVRAAFIQHSRSTRKAFIFKGSDLSSLEQMPDKLFMSENALGFYLRRARVALGYSLRDLESISGVSNSQIYRIEAGDFQCTLDTYIRLCRALGLPFGRTIEAIAWPQEETYSEVITKDPKVIELIQRSGIRSEQRRQIAVGFFETLCALTEYLVLCSSPIRAVNSIDFPTVALKSAFEDFARRMDEEPEFPERAAILRSLEKRGFAELESQSLCSQDIAMEYLSFVSKAAFGKAQPIGQPRKVGTKRLHGFALWTPIASLDPLKLIARQKRV